MANSETILHFGKYKGKTVAEVRAENPGYLIWAHENVGTFALDDGLVKPIFDEAVAASYRRGAERASASAGRAIMRPPFGLPTDMSTDGDDEDDDTPDDLYGGALSYSDFGNN